MKTIKTFLFIAIVLLCNNVFAQWTPATDLNGSGTESDPWQIETAHDLEQLANFVRGPMPNNYIVIKGKHFKLINDIDLYGYYWQGLGCAIGNYDNFKPFTATFDGNEKTISNVYINNDDNYCGLFGVIAEATIKNLGVVNCNINGTEYLGGLVGYVYGSTNELHPFGTSNIENCYVTGTVNGTGHYVGGIVGSVKESAANYLNISNCWSGCDVSGQKYVGGIMGSFVNTGTMEYCYATGDIYGNFAAGIIGAVSGATVKNCIAINENISSPLLMVRRICNGDMLYTTIYNSYALNTMVLTNANGIVTPVEGSKFDGVAVSYETLISYLFYTTQSNWYNNEIWDIEDPDGIWKICGAFLPFLRYQDLDCDAFIAVTDIVDLPTHATVGEPLILTGTVVPSFATNQTITWSVISSNGTGATITNGNIFNAFYEGSPQLLATIENGSAPSSNYYYYFYITVEPAPQISVTDIINVPNSMSVGSPLILTGDIVPANATNQIINWSIKNAGNTGATLNNNILNAMYEGVVTVTATVVNGIAIGENFEKDFSIAVNTLFVSVTNITGVITTMFTGDEVYLEGTVVPTNATNQTIVWSIKNAGTTGAILNGNLLYASNNGTIKVTATIEDGIAIGQNFAKEFTIRVYNKIGINEFENKNEVLVYPNPVIDNINIKSNNALGEIKIYDVSGNLIINQKNLNNETIINVSFLKSGIYVIILNNLSYKLIKQ